METTPEVKEKIVLPKNLQREMIKFFMNTSMPRIQAQREAEAEKAKNETKTEVKGNTKKQKPSKKQKKDDK